MRPGFPLPLDIVRRIATVLDAQQAHGTLATLLRLDKATYEALTPLVYRRLVISGESSDALLALSIPLDASGQPVNFDDGALHAREEGTYFSPESPWRRLASLRHVRHLTVEALVPESTSSILLESGSAPHSLFPALRTVEFRPTALHQIRTFVPPYARSRSKPQTHPFLLLLARTADPTHVCLSFALVPSRDWEEHRDSTLVGQYQLVARLSRLKDDGWSSLTTVTVHNVVHQLLPSIPGCVNTYHFSPHVLALPSSPSCAMYNLSLGPASRPQASRPIAPSTHKATPTLRLLRGPESVGQPGLQWNYRAWQIGQSIKSLFPSGADAGRVLEGTSWRFVGVRNHILTKQWRDDDDESGVGYDEATPLIRDCVRAGLSGDLPAREGFERSLVQDVWDRMAWIEDGDEQRCRACGQASPL